MPASSIAALNSWGLYIVAAFALLLVLSPALSAVSSDSREGADLRSLDGVSAVLSALRPGVSARFSFGTSPAGDPILIGEHSLVCSYGSGLVETHTVAELPDETIYPTVAYLAYVSGDRVAVVPAG
ncbi:MAG: hypothetical protein JRN57_04245 [Nitrososphaerota archaeon]|nr:hypothetical protein [Nitrososphaerota archaeon]